ncbi:MAG: glycosyltransferase family 4 protein [Acidobacteriota bacterium]|nr:glycosyltransferase family 4 protein [Acidobacteriota bacterium]MDH3522935.1 glycosyltransferase family 4 protein [Acidobacteriota bacterium]
MRIGVSALAMRGSAEDLDSGVARYCAALVDAWIVDAGGHELVVWTAPDFELPQRWRGCPTVRFERAAGAWARYKTLWEWFSAAAAARSRGCEVWFSTAHAVPLRPVVPTVLSIQDLFTFTHPELYTRKHRLVIGLALARAIRSADGLVAISEHTRGQLAERFGVARERVAVTPLGLGHRVEPVAASEVPASALAALGVGGERFLLTVSTVEPRKNLPRLCEAFARLAAEPRWADLRLVVAGSPGWKTAASYRRPRELGIEDRVDFLGYVPDAELAALYARCEAFVLPSIVEGFGLPLLEAMAFGAPVACSGGGALPEVGGDVPVYFDPLDVGDMTRALAELLGAGAARAERAARGRARAARFTWADAAARTLAAVVAAGSAAAPRPGERGPMRQAR